MSSNRPIRSHGCYAVFISYPLGSRVVKEAELYQTEELANKVARFYISSSVFKEVQLGAVKGPVVETPYGFMREVGNPLGSNLVRVTFDETKLTNKVESVRSIGTPLADKSSYLKDCFYVKIGYFYNRKNQVFMEYYETIDLASQAANLYKGNAGKLLNVKQGHCKEKVIDTTEGTRLKDPLNGNVQIVRKNLSGLEARLIGHLKLLA